MTNKQRVLEFLNNWKGENPPTYKQCALSLGLTTKQVCSVVQQCELHNKFWKDYNVKIDGREGETEMRDATKEEQTRIERLLTKEGYNPGLWRLVWAHLKDDLGRKHTVLMKNPEEVKQEELRKEKFIAEMRKHAPKYPTIKYSRVTDGHLKLIDIADLHIGKYAINRDGEVSYDIETAKSNARNAVKEFLKRSQGFKTEKFLFPIGNDVLHVDNKNNTTTSGTRQDVQGLWDQMYLAAKSLYVELLEHLVTIAPVEVIYNRSNHDDHSGFTLADTLESWFHRSKNITFDISTLDRRYTTYGQSMIGFDHGDGAKLKDIPLLMASEEPKIWSDTRFRYMFRHHLHHMQKHHFLVGQDFPGVTVQYLRSLSESDAWHQRMGYTGAPKAVDGFIFHPEYGQVNHMSCVFN